MSGRCLVGAGLIRKQEVGDGLRELRDSRVRPWQPLATRWWFDDHIGVLHAACHGSHLHRRLAHEVDQRGAANLACTISCIHPLGNIKETIEGRRVKPFVQALEQCLGKLCVMPAGGHQGKDLAKQRPIDASARYERIQGSHPWMLSGRITGNGGIDERKSANTVREPGRELGAKMARPQPSQDVKLRGPESIRHRANVGSETIHGEFTAGSGDAEPAPVEHDDRPVVRQGRERRQGRLGLKHCVDAGRRKGVEDQDRRTRVIRAQHCVGDVDAIVGGGVADARRVHVPAIMPEADWFLHTPPDRAGLDWSWTSRRCCHEDLSLVRTQEPERLRLPPELWARL